MYLLPKHQQFFIQPSFLTNAPALPNTASARPNPCCNPHNPYGSEKDRPRLYYHLMNLSPEEQVINAIRRHPNETDPKKLVSSILYPSSSFPHNPSSLLTQDNVCDPKGFRFKPPHYSKKNLVPWSTWGLNPTRVPHFRNALLSTTYIYFLIRKTNKYSLN